MQLRPQLRTIDRKMHKINFEIASERAKVKEHMLMPPNDGQWKHPEHLQQHEFLQVLQREALYGDIEVVKKMVADLPEHQKEDTITMLKRSVAERGRTLEL